MSTDDPLVERESGNEADADDASDAGFDPDEALISHEDDLFNPGHTACAGCGPAISMKTLLEVTGENTIIAQATGCMEVVSSQFPESAWGVGWIHDVFANAPGVMSGVETAYRAFDRRGDDRFADHDDRFTAHDDLNFVVVAGDGATFDMGIRSTSGMMERGHDVLYLAYDNEAYMNTGIQRSSATPYGAATTTSPPGEASFGNDRQKKDMPAIAAAHGCDYVATASIGHRTDFVRKLETALEHDGPKYVQVLAPCPVGWDSDSAETVELARLAVETGIHPLFEMEHGELTDVMTIHERKPVERYLEKQGRYDHLFEREGGEEVVAEIQAFVDARAEELGLDG